MPRIILDTDLAMGAPGSDIDDGFALALAHADPEIELELITTVNGNTDVESATILSGELARRLGLKNVPIVRGAAAPFTHPEVVRTPAENVVGAPPSLSVGTPCPSAARARRSARTRRNQLRRSFRATTVTQPASWSIRSPRSERSHALASACWTASSAAARLPHITESPETIRG